MSIVICFNNKDPQPWKETLLKKLKGVTIEVFPNVKNHNDVLFALCWKPEKNILSKFPNLRVVQSVGAAVDHIVKSQKLPKEIILTRIVDEQLSMDMFEYILAGIMSHMKRFSEYEQDKQQQAWSQKPYKTINDTTISVLGLGEISSYVARRLVQLGFKVQAWSKSIKEIEHISSFCGNEGLQEVLNSTDILVNLLPLTPETENILNLTNLEKLNKNAYLINVGRGEHLVEPNLLTLLDNNHLAGALLDVFRTEPLPKDHPFWQHDKIKITPHVASISNVDSISEIVVTNYIKLLSGEKLLNTVSLEKGY